MKKFRLTDQSFTEVPVWKTTRIALQYWMYEFNLSASAPETELAVTDDDYKKADHARRMYLTLKKQDTSSKPGFEADKGNIILMIDSLAQLQHAILNPFDETITRLFNVKRADKIIMARIFTLLRVMNIHKMATKSAISAIAATVGIPSYLIGDIFKKHLGKN